MFEAIHRALQLNYPNITLQEVKDFFTMRSIFPAYGAATATDLSPLEAEVYEAPGEWVPVGAGLPSPGGTSAGA